MYLRPSQVRRRLAKAVADAGSQKAFAEQCGLSPQYINDCLRNRREISGKLAECLGLKLRRLFWQNPEVNSRNR
jgi:plasmid maintenance system antidote protein VapI